MLKRVAGVVSLRARFLGSLARTRAFGMTTNLLADVMLSTAEVGMYPWMIVRFRWPMSFQSRLRL